MKEEKVNLEANTLEYKLTQKNHKLDSKLKWSRWTLGSALSVAILVIILLLAGNCSGKKELEGCRNQLTQRDDSINHLNKKINDLGNQILNQRAVVDSKSAPSGTLVTAIISDSYDERPSSVFIEKEFVKVPYIVHDTVPCADTFKVECPKCPDCDSVVSDTNKADVVNKNFVISLFKNNYYKKTTETKEMLIGVPTTLLPDGFSENSTTYEYHYVNENGDSSVFSIQGLISGNNVNFLIDQNGKITELNDEIFPLGHNYIPGVNDFTWTSEILYEKIFDSEKFKIGNQKIIVGSITTAGGLVGDWYFWTHPSANIVIRQNGVNIGGSKIFNTFGKVVAGAATVAGPFLVFQGFHDRKFSYVITPFNFSLKYAIN